MSLLCLALRPALARLDIDGPAFSSIFQGAIRWQTYVGLSVSANMFGDIGLALASVAMVAIIPLVNVLSVAVLAHYAAPEKQSARTVVMTVVRNPLICALAIGLLVTGAGLHLEGLLRPSVGVAIGVVFKLVLMPALALVLAAWFGLSGDSLAIVAICAAVPTSPSAYVLARQMGGDAPLLAQIITLQTILAAVTMPIAIALVAAR